MNAVIREYLLSSRANCMGCGSVRGSDKDYLCADCYASINPLYVNGLSIGEICSNCGEEYAAGICSVCKKRRPDTISAAAAYEYDGPIKNLVRAFKFSGVWRMSNWMAEEMLKACDEEFLSGIQLIVPVPMHRMRKLIRGYNQSEKLAEVFSALTGIRYEKALKRVRNTRQQSKLSGEVRRKNLNGAFRAERSLDGESILLIDDVRTTGTTAVECARTLLHSGACSVRVLTFAKALTCKPGMKKYHPDKGVKLIKYEKDVF